MKKGIIKSVIRKELSVHRKLYILSLILFITGILSGCIICITSDTIQFNQTKEYINNFIVAYPLQGVSNFEIFKLSLFNYFKIFLIVFLSGFNIFLLPLGAYQIVLKGIKLGYTVSILLNTYHLKGFIFSLFSFLFQNIIFIPFLIIYFVYQIKLASQKRKKMKTDRNLFIKNLFFLIIGLIIIMICAYIEGYFVPALLKVIHSFM